MIHWIFIGILSFGLWNLWNRMKVLEQKADRRVDLTQPIRAEAADVAETLVDRHVQEYHAKERK